MGSSTSDSYSSWQRKLRQQPGSIMRPVFLERVTIRFHGEHRAFNNRLCSLLAALGQNTPNGFELMASNPALYPRLVIDFQSARPEITADFFFSGGETVSIVIENMTGVTKRNALPYQPIGIEEVSRRLETAGWNIIGIDHIGFNLPWFGPGIHPRILALRENLAGACLYHEYPSGEPWDFILPGSPEEITGRMSLDYSITRRPKFELVSFDGASTPLVQIDLGVNARFEDISRRFPEALADPALRQTWIYLENPYPIDVCLAVSKYTEEDWSHFFAGHRLPARAGKSPP